MDRPCRKCGLTLPFTQFEKHRHCKDGRISTCKTCREAKRKDFWQTHPQTSKMCKPCGRLLDVEKHFYRLGSGGYHSWCKECASAQARRKYQEPETRQKALSERAAYRKANRDKLIENDRASRLLRKIRVFEHYGNGVAACVCCGVSEMEFLTLDHIAADGADHRKVLRKTQGGNGTGWFIYKWLIDNNYPEGYQVLCFNCNVGKHRTKVNMCPHVLTRQELTGIIPGSTAHQAV